MGKKGEQLAAAYNGRVIVSGSRYYDLYPDGRIASKDTKPSSDWLCTGAVTRNNFGRVSRVYSLAEIILNAPEIPWKFKNGKQKTYITDLDHGTPREWGSPGHSVY